VKVPPSQCEDEQTAVEDGDVLRQQAVVAVGLGLLAVEVGSCPGVEVGRKAMSNKSRRNQTPRGEPPRVFSEFFRNNWVKKACRDVANQALVPASRNAILRDEPL
jgi:hypothetical protein